MTYNIHDPKDLKRVSEIIRQTKVGFYKMHYAWRIFIGKDEVHSDVIFGRRQDASTAATIWLRQNATPNIEYTINICYEDTMKVVQSITYKKVQKMEAT